METTKVKTTNDTGVVTRKVHLYRFLNNWSNLKLKLFDQFWTVVSTKYKITENIIVIFIDMCL